VNGVRTWKEFVVAIVSVPVLLAPSAVLAGDSGAVRPYLVIRPELGIYSDPDSAAGLELDSPSRLFANLTFGANLSRHWGVELSADYTETRLKATGVTERIGDYSTWMLLPQVRYRYPLLDSTLVPYAVGGVGIGIGELNDRNALHTDVQFGAGADATVIGAVGLGLEYFLNDSVAFGVEAKRILGFETDVTYLGRPRELDAGQTLLSAGLRVFLDDPGEAERPESAPMPGSSGATQAYIVARTGAGVFSNPDASVGGIEMGNPTRIRFGAGVGANFGRHWGVELSGDYWGAPVSAPGFGEVTENALWTMLAHLRYRFPIEGSRLVPYVMGGTGVGWSQLNDRRLPAAIYPIRDETHTSIIGSLGGGLDYMLSDNVALGVETRYLFGFENEITVGNTTGTLDNDTVLALLHLRVLFP
jgi:opacity protein-like surface antigen